MNSLDKNYQELLCDILEHGVIKEDRTGTGTLSVFGRQIRHKMSEGFPILTTKKMAVKSMMIELKWFLKGDTNIKYLVDNGCNIWNGDAYKRYKRVWEYDLDEPLSESDFIERIKKDEDFARVWGELGPIYGKQWRSWKINLIDPHTMEFVPPVEPIQNLINDLKTNPDSRRLMVNAWNVGELDEMVLPPCHYGFQVYTKEMNLEERIEWNYQNSDPLGRSMDFFPEHLDAMGVPKRKISLMWNQRSVDTFLGLPFNVSSYGMLLILIAKEVNMVPDELVGNLGDTHLYLNHLTQAKEQVKRKPYGLPTMYIKNFDFLNGEFDWELSDYQSHPTIKAPLSN